jgi:hypothetical protein
MTRGNGLFAPRVLPLFIAVGTAAFFCSVFLMLFGDSTRSAGHDTFSHSAIGHSAFKETLQRLGVPVSVSRFKTLEKTGGANLLMLIEPPTDDIGSAMLRDAKRESHVLLVLPKWDAIPHWKRRDWIGGIDYLDTKPFAHLVGQFDDDAEIVRSTTADTKPTQNRFGFTPALHKPQFIRSAKLKPLIAYGDDILVGEIKLGNATLWVLSDPDIIANAGLAMGDNADLAAALIDEQLPLDGSVIIDETIHGFEQSPDLLRAAFELPFLPATVAFALAVLVAILAGISRFGPVQPARPALSPGRAAFLRNVADLIEFGQGGGAVLRRYPRLVLADVAARLRAPATLNEDSLVAWADQRAERLGMTLRMADLRAESDALSGRHGQQQSAATIGRRINQWRQEILHEPRNRPRHERAPQGGSPQGDRRPR